MSKKAQLKAAFLRGEVLTPLIALNKYRCLSLSQRVGDFKRCGLPIKDAFVEGQPFKKYWLDPQSQLEIAA